MTDIEIAQKAKLVKINEIAEKIGLSEEAIRNWVRNKKIPQKYLKLLEQDKENSIFNQGNNNININGHNNGQIHINSSNEIDLEICNLIKRLNANKKKYIYHLIMAEILRDEGKE